jgi:hypothetical protein
MSEPPVSVLVVAALPDDRESTGYLEMLVDELSARPGVRATVWYLRELHYQGVPPDRHVVDRLRTLPGLRQLDAVGAGKLAHAVRGRVLRRWYRKVAPDVVVLDDGLGLRVLDVADPRPPVVVRHNPEPPPYAELEPPARRTGDLTVVAAARAGEFTDVPDAYVQLPWATGAEAGRPYRDPEARSRVRRQFDLPTDVPLVVGWGDDGWLDGPDLFVRTLWALEHRHGVAAHGVWFGLSSDPREAERLCTEAARCGLADRFWHRPQVGIDAQSCGDVVLLPYRSPVDPVDLAPALVSGAGLVTFRSTAPLGPGVDRVDELDVEAAAAAVAGALRADRSARTDQTAHLTPGPLADQVVALGRGFRAGRR